MAALGPSCSTRGLCCMCYLSVAAGELLGAAWELPVMVCGIQFPDQGSNLGPLYWKRRVSTIGPRGKSLNSFRTLVIWDLHFVTLHLLSSSTLYFFPSYLVILAPSGPLLMGNTGGVDGGERGGRMYSPGHGGTCLANFSSEVPCPFPKLLL